MTEPTVQVPVSLVERTIEVADQQGIGSLASEYRALISEPTPTAEPARIEDLAPGTTFTAQVRFLIDSHGTALPHTGFDPSKIRDVQPPKEAA